MYIYMYIIQVYSYINIFILGAPNNTFWVCTTKNTFWVFAPKNTSFQLCGSSIIATRLPRQRPAAARARPDSGRHQNSVGNSLRNSFWVSLP